MSTASEHLVRFDLNGERRELTVRANTRLIGDRMPRFKHLELSRFRREVPVLGDENVAVLLKRPKNA